MSYEVRPATIDDIPAIARLGRLFHEQAGWGDIIDYVEDDCVSSLRSFFDAGVFLCFVADRGGEIVGMASAIMAPVYFNHGHRSAEELFWWVTPDAPQGTGMKLLAVLADAERNAGCQSSQMKCVEHLNGERMARLYKRAGYRESERSFIKELI